MGFLDRADPVLYFLGLSSLLKLYVLRKQVLERRVLVGKVTDLILHPLKSGKGVKVKAVTCSFREGPHSGSITDRRWMVTTDDYSVINYKQFPILSTVTPEYQGGYMTFTPATSHKPLSVNIRSVVTQNKIITASAYGTTVEGLDCGDAAAQWLNNFLGEGNYRLVYAPPQFDTHRDVKTGNVSKMDWTKVAKEEDVIAYQSVTPYHIITQDTMEDLNSRLNSPVGFDRFRPNIIISEASPYAEDCWKKMWVGEEAMFSTIRLTGRCVFVTIDPETGITGSEPLKTLTGYRSLMKDYSPCLGIHMVLEREGQIRVGDPVYATLGDNTIKP